MPRTIRYGILMCAVFGAAGLPRTGGAEIPPAPQPAGENPSVQKEVPLTPCAAGGPRYAEAFREFQAGNRLSAAGDAASVDRFFSAAIQSWKDVEEGLAEQPPRLLLGSLNLYNSAVLSTVIAGHRLGRLDPAAGLKVVIDGRWQIVPVRSVGLPWRLDQIDCFLPPATCYQDPTFACSVRSGVGAAIQGVHINRPNEPGEEYYLDRQPVTITAVLREVPAAGWRLEFHSPISHRSLAVAGRELALSSNIAASVQYAVRQLETQVNPWTAFFDPEVAVNHEGLLFFQPYQPGKIPIVLVHGLLSNPATWGAMINELLNTPELMAKYQIWAYLYPTSVPFLETASELREDLRNTLAFLDLNGEDPALEHMILIGHSMGGLLSRLQVTWSGNFLWDEFSRVPFGQIQGDAATRQKLAEMYFFGPQPFVKRVVFMAVPHRGSILSSRVIGCLGRILAGRLPSLEDMWIELRRLNPEAFPRCWRIGMPNSVDQLAPNSPAIRGLQKLPFAPWVHLHSIIGTGGCCGPCCPGDGVVSVRSARIAGVDSEFFVDAPHAEVNENPQAIREVERILWVHWAAYEQELPPIDLPSPAPLRSSIPSQIVPAQRALVERRGN